MVESPTPDNPIKKQYIITIESKTIEVYAESIAEALSLGGLNDETMATYPQSTPHHE